MPSLTQLYPCWDALSQEGFSEFAVASGCVSAQPVLSSAIGGAGREAEALEAALSIPVLRHAQKKPAGDAAEAEAHFGCAQPDRVVYIVARLLRARLAGLFCCVYAGDAFTSSQAHGPACSLG